MKKLENFKSLSQEDLIKINGGCFWCWLGGVFTGYNSHGHAEGVAIGDMYGDDAILPA